MLPIFWISCQINLGCSMELHHFIHYWQLSCLSSNISSSRTNLSVVIVGWVRVAQWHSIQLKVLRSRVWIPAVTPREREKEREREKGRENGIRLNFFHHRSLYVHLVEFWVIFVIFLKEVYYPEQNFKLVQNFIFNFVTKIIFCTYLECEGNLWPYSQHFICFVTHESAQ